MTRSAQNPLLAAARFPWLVCLLGAVFLCGDLRAQILLGNLPAANDGSGTTIASTSWKGISFTTPAAPAYFITSVDLRLENYSAATSADAAVGFYTDSGNQPASLVSLLTDAPLGASPALGTFSFLPATTLSLTPNTKYWLVVGGEGSGDFEFKASTSPNIPAGAATPGSFLRYLDGTWSSSGVENSFQINAATVPEPAHLGLAGATLLLGLAAGRRFITARAKS